MNLLYPLKLIPVAKEILWGGYRLKEAYHKSAPFDKLAETWELSVRPKEMNRIENGPCSGMTLDAYIRQLGFRTVSPHYTGERFPLLIKFIDACDRLSIQVHPDDEYSLANEGELGKTEMWYIVEAEPGASLVYGLKDGISAGEFSKAVREGRIEETLHFVEVHAGETYFIPAGQIHAIGSGILIAEIQQNSNVTYRVYDYDRPQTDGTLRPLHTQKALDTIKIRTDAEIERIRFSHTDHSAAELASCPYFRVRRLGTENLPAAVTPADSFIHLLCVDGNGFIISSGEKFPVRKGDSWFLPRGCGECHLNGSMTVLLSEAKEKNL